MFTAGRRCLKCTRNVLQQRPDGATAATLLQRRIPVRNHHELCAVIVSAADEEDSPIPGNVEREALSDRGFDYLRDLPCLPHDQVRTAFRDFSHPNHGVVALVEDGMSVLLPNGIAAETRRNGNSGSGARVRCGKYSLSSGFPRGISDPTHVRRKNAVRGVKG